VANKKSSKTPVPKTSQKCWSILSSKHKKTNYQNWKWWCLCLLSKETKDDQISEMAVGVVPLD
jgi:hypothetical protein